MEEKGETNELQNLIRLQQLQRRIEELNLRVKEAPQEIDSLDHELADDKLAVEEAQQAIDESGKEGRRLELEIEDLRRKLSHQKDRLMEVKTNAEYQATLHEISYVQKQIGAKEDQILEQMIDVDDLNTRLKSARQALTERQEEIAARKQELRDLITSATAELELDGKALEELEAGIAENTLKRYRQIASVRNGVAMAKVVDHSCEKCHVRLRPQLFAEVKAGHRMILCENCSRILYIESE